MTGDELGITLATVGGAASVVTAITQTVKRSFPWLEGDRAVLFSWLVGPLVMLAAWWLRFTPPAVDWRTAVGMGILAALSANGVYSAGKVLITPPEQPPKQAEPVLKRQRSTPAPVNDGQPEG